ncbi:MAG: helix-hairpin-helix domain-containing protein [Candidatus Freyarchaeota archaeon]
MVSFLEILIYLVPIAVGTLMAVIGDRLKLYKLPESKVKIKKDAPVTKVKGVGEETAKTLQKYKINTVEDLVKADKKKLAKVKGVDKKTVKKLVKFALKQMMED